MQARVKKRILVAPLNWGLGHATRCIPIVNALKQFDFEPIIASDGEALQLLEKEFPALDCIELPSYNIRYSKKPEKLKLKLLKDTPYFLKTIIKEKKFIKKLVEKHAVSGLISDNRFGVQHQAIPSAFITHQLQVLSGNTTWLSTRIHQNIISKFDECWVPDYATGKTLSGILGHVKNLKTPVKYMMPLSRFEKQELQQKYDLLVVLSGPEPQRTFLEEKLFYELRSFKGRICFVKGVVEPIHTKVQHTNMTIYNYLTSKALETALNQSHIVLCRSGYTTVMDLAKLNKKAFFIPTPKQPEQGYLAKKLHDDGIAPFCHQDDFSVELLSKVEAYTGFQFKEFETDYQSLFRLF